MNRDFLRRVKREQGAPYMAFDAQSGRMRLVTPTTPKLLKVTIKKPTTKTKYQTPTVPKLSELAELSFRNNLKAHLKDLRFTNVTSKRDVDDALHTMQSALKLGLRSDVHSALLKMQTLAEPSHRVPTGFFRPINLYSLFANTYVLPHKDFSQVYGPGFWAASNVLWRRMMPPIPERYNAVFLKEITLVLMTAVGFTAVDNAFIKRCPTLLQLLNIRFLYMVAPNLIRDKLEKEHELKLTRMAEQFKRDEVGVDEMLSLADALILPISL